MGAAAAGPSASCGYAFGVGPIVVLRLIRRSRGHLAGLVAVFALASVLAMHHGEMGGGEMGGMHHEPGAAMTMTVCLGAFVALGAAVASLAVGSVRLGRWGVVRLAAPGALLRAEELRSRSRAGPPGAAVLSVWRI